MRIRQTAETDRFAYSHIAAQGCLQMLGHPGKLCPAARQDDVVLGSRKPEILQGRRYFRDDRIHALTNNRVEFRTGDARLAGLRRHVIGSKVQHFLVIARI